VLLESDIRIIPYRTLDNRIDGVLITFMDITVTKTLEAKLRKTPRLRGSGNREREQN